MMMNLLRKTGCVLVLLTVFVISSCQEPPPPSVLALDAAPDINAIEYIYDYAIDSMEATGGFNAWLSTTNLPVNSVVTFYNPDGDFYLTEQRYEIYPWSSSLRIFSKEPQGRFVWLLSGGSFSLTDGNVYFDRLPMDVCPRYFAEAMLYITTASARFLDKSVHLTKITEPVKIEGRWHQPIESALTEKTGVEPYLTKIIFYQDKDTSLTDMLWFATTDGKFFTVRGYDYHEVEYEGIRIPDKIEIFSTDEQALIKRRLVKVDFK